MEAPNAGVEDCGVPKTPVDVPPNTELPVWEPKGLILPKGLGAKGLSAQKPIGSQMGYLKTAQKLLEMDKKKKNQYQSLQA